MKRKIRTLSEALDELAKPTDFNILLTALNGGLLKLWQDETAYLASLDRKLSHQRAGELAAAYLSNIITSRGKEFNKKVDAAALDGTLTPEDEANYDKLYSFDDHCPGCPYNCGDTCVEKRKDLHPELKKENAQSVINHITDIMDAIYNYPEYGKVWYNSEKSEIVVSIGDGFENEESLEKALKKIPGIKDVDIDAEIPAPKDPGYTLVYPKNHKTIGDLIKGD